MRGEVEGLLECSRAFRTQPFTGMRTVLVEQDPPLAARVVDVGDMDTVFAGDGREDHGSRMAHVLDFGYCFAGDGGVDAEGRDDGTVLRQGQAAQAVGVVASCRLFGLPSVV